MEVTQRTLDFIRDTANRQHYHCFSDDYHIVSRTSVQQAPNANTIIHGVYTSNLHGQSVDVKCNCVHCSTS